MSLPYRTPNNLISDTEWSSTTTYSTYAHIKAAHESHLRNEMLKNLMNQQAQLHQQNAMHHYSQLLGGSGFTVLNTNIPDLNEEMIKSGQVMKVEKPHVPCHCHDCTQLRAGPPKESTDIKKLMPPAPPREEKSTPNPTPTPWRLTDV